MPPDSEIPPPLTAPPVLSERPADPAAGLRRPLAALLGVFLALFLADAVVGFANASLVLCHIYGLMGLSSLLSFFAMLMAVLVYVLMGLTPLIPKRVFLPVTLFYPAVMLLMLPCMIYFYPQLFVLEWISTLAQVLLGLGILWRLHGGLKFRWPLVPESRLGGRRFGWPNLLGFALVNLFVALPAVAAYSFCCAGLAMNHFTDGFMTLHPGGLTAQVRKYVRDDGKTIQLVPMVHIADRAFYRQVAQSFPTNALILMEGVSDHQNLLTNKISYKRFAKSLGLTEQVREFHPDTNQMVRADVDVSQFSPDTLGMLNLVMYVHAKGVNALTLHVLQQYSPPPQIEQEVWGDILGKRNLHLLGGINTRLSQADCLIVPWGAAHMPQIAAGIQKSGFHLSETQEFTVIHFFRFKDSRPPAKIN